MESQNISSPKKIDKSKLFIANIFDYENKNQQQISTYTITVFEFFENVLVSINSEETKNKKILKKYKISFNNIDEQINFFYGLKYDLNEIIFEEDEYYLLIEKKDFDIIGFIKNKLTIMPWKDFFDGSVVNVNEYLTSSEVTSKLRISDQTLSNWRKKGLLEFKKISPRKYLYNQIIIDEIFKNGISDYGFEEKEFNGIKKENNFDVTYYRLEIIKILKPLVFKIEEYKFKHQNYFFNFGNLNIKSSPQVMINNECQLVDFIKKEIIIDSPKELYQYLVDLFSDGKQPQIDSSKKISGLFSDFYLNNLKNQ